MTKQQIEADIKAISEELKGPMSDIERRFLVADRIDLVEKLDRVLDLSGAKGGS